MVNYLGSSLEIKLKKYKSIKGKNLVMGLTFKENVKDIRNSKPLNC